MCYPNVIDDSETEGDSRAFLRSPWEEGRTSIRNYCCLKNPRSLRSIALHPRSRRVLHCPGQKHLRDLCECTHMYMLYICYLYVNKPYFYECQESCLRILLETTLLPCLHLKKNKDFLFCYRCFVL